MDPLCILFASTFLQPLKKPGVTENCGHRVSHHTLAVMGSCRPHSWGLSSWVLQNPFQKDFRASPVEQHRAGGKNMYHLCVQVKLHPRVWGRAGNSPFLQWVILPGALPHPCWKDSLLSCLMAAVPWMECPPAVHRHPWALCWRPGRQERSSSHHSSWPVIPCKWSDSFHTWHSCRCSCCHLQLGHGGAGLAEAAWLLLAVAVWRGWSIQLLCYCLSWLLQPVWSSALQLQWLSQDQHLCFHSFWPSQGTPVALPSGRHPRLWVLGRDVVLQSKFGLALDSLSRAGAGEETLETEAFFSTDRVVWKSKLSATRVTDERSAGVQSYKKPHWGDVLPSGVTV